VSEPVAEIWNEISASTGVPLAGLGFIYGAFDFNRRRVARESNGADNPPRHCTAAELCAAFLEFAKNRYGDNYVAALTSWQLNTSEKLGQAVYALVGRKLIGQQDGDLLSDFDDQFDLSNDVRGSSTRVFNYPTAYLRQLVPVTFSPGRRSPVTVAILFVAVWFVAVVIGAWIADYLNFRDTPLAVHFIAIALGVVAVSLEYPYRFSLRALLLTITALALTFGLIKCLFR